jgi:hypothetical protein
MGAAICIGGKLGSCCFDACQTEDDKTPLIRKRFNPVTYERIIRKFITGLIQSGKMATFKNNQERRAYILRAKVTGVEQFRSQEFPIRQRLANEYFK